METLDVGQAAPYGSEVITENESKAICGVSFLPLTELPYARSGIVPIAAW